MPGLVALRHARARATTTTTTAAAAAAAAATTMTTELADTHYYSC